MYGYPSRARNDTEYLQLLPVRPTLPATVCCARLTRKWRGPAAAALVPLYFEAPVCAPCSQETVAAALLGG